MEQNRRDSTDRRATNAGFFSLRRLHGRRRGLRRLSDPQTGGHHIDWYEARLFLAVLALMVLCVADAHNTLQLIQIGVAKEANPVMGYLLRKGTPLFLAGKFGITAVCLIVLVACHNYPLLKKFHTRHAIYTFLFFYMALAIVQVAAWPGTEPAMLFIPLEEVEAFRH